MSKISLREKRFLIIWVLFHAFALFLSIAEIKGNYENGYYFSNSSSTKDFWPFAGFNNEGYSPNFKGYDASGSSITRYEPYSTFKGIFNGYDLTEFIAYMVLGLGIVFIPKIWSKNEQYSDNQYLKPGSTNPAKHGLNFKSGDMFNYRIGGKTVEAKIGLKSQHPNEKDYWDVYYLHWDSGKIVTVRISERYLQHIFSKRNNPI